MQYKYNQIDYIRNSTRHPERREDLPAVARIKLKKHDLIHSLNPEWDDLYRCSGWRRELPIDFIL